MTITGSKRGNMMMEFPSGTKPNSIGPDEPVASSGPADRWCCERRQLLAIPARAVITDAFRGAGLEDRPIPGLAGR
ncbi:MAG TPA: hypothetical protein VF892_16925, partial [Pseudonocardiaceae bacterium]